VLRSKYKANAYRIRLDGEKQMTGPRQSDDSPSIRWCDFHEGDLVTHRSFPQILRVVGVGTTIAVEFPSGEMRAFERLELKKVAITDQLDAAPHARAYRWFVSVNWPLLAVFLGLIWLVLVGVLLARLWQWSP
jgi:hypothetical protein